MWYEYRPVITIVDLLDSGSPIEELAYKLKSCENILAINPRDLPEFDLDEYMESSSNYTGRSDIHYGVPTHDFSDGAGFCGYGDGDEFLFRTCGDFDGFGDGIYRLSEVGRNLYSIR